MPITSDFRGLVKDIRLQVGLSQENLARELGVSFATVNRWENGLVKPSPLAVSRFEAFCRKMVEQGRLESQLLNRLLKMPPFW